MGFGDLETRSIQEPVFQLQNAPRNLHQFVYEALSHELSKTKMPNYLDNSLTEENLNENSVSIKIYSDGTQQGS